MPGMLRRAMVYLGLVDDDYDDYEPSYEEQPPPVQARQPRAYSPEPSFEPAPTSSIRTLPRESPANHEGPTTMSSVTPRPSVVRAVPQAQNAKVHVIAPAQFPDAKEIGDRLRGSQPVIVNLQAADRELERRMIDFCSGAAYVLGGSMDKVADHVFLLTPTNVEVSAEEKRRLQERGLYRT
ncbi:MAG TPA: cell division protein SepF [Acidimicrobiales bacterium]|nr:cell division protein SepF [Acidimicrobiales bacterium]